LGLALGATHILNVQPGSWADHRRVRGQYYAPAKIVGGPKCLRLWDPPWYPRCAKDAVPSWSAEDPNFLLNFRARVLDRRDQPYVRDLILRMYDACPADQL